MQQKSIQVRRPLSGLLIDAFVDWILSRMISRSRRTGTFKQPLFVLPADLIGRRIISTGSFERTQLDGLDLLLSDPTSILGFDVDCSGTFVDVGANIGLYTLRYSPCFKRTLAVEANPATYHALIANLLISSSRTVDAECIGASNRSGISQIHVATSGMIGWSRLGSDASWDTYPVDINVDTLDHIAASTRSIGRVALLKIDVEGHELEVLQGASKILAEDQPIVLFEALSGSAGTATAELLKGAGYSHFLAFSRKLSATSIVQGIPVVATFFDRSPTAIQRTCLCDKTTRNGLKDTSVLRVAKGTRIA